MTDTGKQTSLFFGFLTAAMTYASAQAAQPAPQQPTAASAPQRTEQTVSRIKETALKSARTARDDDAGR